jgi:hypothetical protein
VHVNSCLQEVVQSDHRCLYTENHRIMINLKATGKIMLSKAKYKQV